MVLSILIIPRVSAITSEEVLYDKNGEEKVLKKTLDELYTELNICYTKGDATSNDIVSGKSAYVKGAKVTDTGGNWKVYDLQDSPKSTLSPLITFPEKIVPIEEIANVKADGTAGIVPTFKDGSWVSVASKGTTTSFTIDLGFTPTELASCNINLYSDVSTIGNTKGVYGFRYNRGYSSGTTTATYESFLQATLNKHTSWGSSFSATNKSGYSTQCVINGSKLSFVVGNEYQGTGGGYPVYTSAVSFYMSGFFTYK